MLTFTEFRKRRYYYKLIKYLSFFSRSKLLVRNYLKRDDYEKYILTHNIKSRALLNTLKDVRVLTNIETPIHIQPGLLGKSIKDVIKENGKPTLIFREGAITVFVYRWRLKLLKNKCIIQLYKNRVFSITFCYQSSETGFKSNIVNILAQKYLNHKIAYPDMLNYKITDHNNNLIFMNEDLFGLKVNYLYNKESRWFDAMLNELYYKKETNSIPLKIKEKLFYGKI